MTQDDLLKLCAKSDIVIAELKRAIAEREKHLSEQPKKVFEFEEDEA